MHLKIFPHKESQPPSAAGASHTHNVQVEREADPLPSLLTGHSGRSNSNHLTAEGIPGISQLTLVKWSKGLYDISVKVQRHYDYSELRSLTFSHCDFI